MEKNLFLLQAFSIGKNNLKDGKNERQELFLYMVFILFYVVGIQDKHV